MWEFLLSLKTWALLLWSSPRPLLSLHSRRLQMRLNQLMPLKCQQHKCSSQLPKLHLKVLLHLSRLQYSSILLRAIQINQTFKARWVSTSTISSKIISNPTNNVSLKLQIELTLYISIIHYEILYNHYDSFLISIATFLLWSYLYTLFRCKLLIPAETI